MMSAYDEKAVTSMTGLSIQLRTTIPKGRLSGIYGNRIRKAGQLPGFGMKFSGITSINDEPARAGCY